MQIPSNINGRKDVSLAQFDLSASDVSYITVDSEGLREDISDNVVAELLHNSKKDPFLTMKDIFQMSEKDLLEKTDVELIELAKRFDDPMLSAHVEHYERCISGKEKTSFMSSRKDLVFLLLAAIKHAQKENDFARRESVANLPEGGCEVPKQMSLPIVHMPTDLCRVSPFFPMSKNEKNVRPFIDNAVIARSSWGEILYTGPKLSTEEEDVLMGLLSVVYDPSKRIITDVDGEATFSYRGPFRPVLVSMGKENFGKKEYERAWRSIKLLCSCVLEELKIYRRVKAGGEEEGYVEIRKHTLHKILTHARWEEDKVLEYTINPFFYRHFMAGSLTRIDLKKRASLIMPIAKHMYRFMKSHQADVWHGHYMKLAEALNIDLDLPAKEIRRYIKNAVSRNIEKGTFLPGSGFTVNSRDIVRIIRAKDDSKMKFTNH